MFVPVELENLHTLHDAKTTRIVPAPAHDYNTREAKEEGRQMLKTLCYLDLLLQRSGDSGYNILRSVYQERFDNMFTMA